MVSMIPALVFVLLAANQGGALPERVLLTWAGDPATTQAVTWRSVASGGAQAQIVVATPSPSLEKGSTLVRGVSQSVAVAEGRSANYHTVRFTGLRPSTLYAYRVGDGRNWSEWAHFRTATAGFAPFSFIYVGDAQNDLRMLWSRAIRGAFQEAAKARFILHAGDLINNANNDDEWGEWFGAAGWINKMVPSIATPGNHEYSRGTLSRLWRPQFEYPLNGVPGLEESCYTLTYQGVRIVSLDSNRMLKEQAAWLDQVLSRKGARWTVVTFHHPIYSLAGDRSNDAVRDAWRPILEKHEVDLVLTGHDHTYGRTKNLPSGTNARGEGNGPVYVVSVSGPKMYRITDPKKAEPMKRVAEGTQLYQTVTVEQDRIVYRAFTVTGEIYDAFELRKDGAGLKKLVELPVASRERRGL